MLFLIWLDAVDCIYNIRLFKYMDQKKKKCHRRDSYKSYKFRSTWVWVHDDSIFIFV